MSTTCQDWKHVGPRVLPVSEFYKNARAKSGLHYYCKACMRRRARESYAQIARSQYVTPYVEKSRELLAAQDGGCAVCHARLDAVRAKDVQIVWHRSRARAAVCVRCFTLVKPGSPLERQPTLARSIVEYFDRLACDETS